MELKNIEPIGIIHTPFRTREKTVPIQSRFSKEIGEVEVFKEYEDGLKDIEGFSHIILLYIFHKSEGYSLHAKPFLDSELRGVFATRSPRRPNPIGMSTVILIERKGNILKVKGVDMLDETPLLDIKPYVPRFDERTEVSFGWLEDKL